MKKIVKNFVVSATLMAALLVAVAVQAKDATLTGTTGVVESLGKVAHGRKSLLINLLKWVRPSVQAAPLVLWLPSDSRTLTVWLS